MNTSRMFPKQVEKDQHLKSVIIHHDSPSVHRAAQTEDALYVNLIDHPA